MFRNCVFKFKCIILILYLKSNLIICSDSEYYSSISGMENLLRTEVILYEEMQNYINSVLDHVEQLQSELAAIKQEHLAAASDIEGYLNNPVNAYRLIKRLHSDWSTLEDSIRNDASRTNFLEAIDIYHQNLSFPTENDLYGSAVALVRLQETYQLDVAQVASGILNSVKYGNAMNWQDCFLLGQNLYAMRDFNHTIPWFKQSMKMFMDNQFTADPMALDFIEAVAEYHREMGDFETALSLTNRILLEDPARENAFAAKTFLEEMITSGVKKGLMHETAALPTSYHQSNEFKLYEKVCRAEITITSSAQRQLHCKYYSNNVAYRLLQPFKMEIHYLDPYIVQFHDIIRDAEMNVVKRMAKPKMARSQVRTPDGTEDEAASFRTSKSAWFRYGKNRIMNKMRQNVQDFSALNVRYVEELQVANYGIGGHYEPHFDFFTDEKSFEPILGNRAATAIYYLSDVEEGGATAFPYLHILVKPKKGSVLFWYNLHSSEDPDYRTKHAACPVLKGSKWIANIWIRIRNQDHARPCGLTQEKDLSIAFKDYN